MMKVSANRASNRRQRFHAGRIFAFVLVACGWTAACFNDYDKFNASGSGDAALAASGGGGATGGAAGGPMGGNAGSAGADGSLGGSSGSAGTGGATGGTAGGGGSSDSGSGGTAGALGGSAGSGPCGTGETDCSGVCVVLSTNHEHCGSCDNNCRAQGVFPYFSCVASLCACTANEQCLTGGAGVVSCDTASGRCVCDGMVCARGEACARVGPSQTCMCNNAAACAPGLTCCQTPAGCRDLQSDAQNCGACGNTCPSGQSCSGGVCS